MKHKYHTQPAFTLVEIAVVAPIIILFIGVFIGLIVSVTGNIMSTRGENVLIYNTQSALNRIESDVQASTGFLQSTNIDISATGQGKNDSVDSGSTTAFDNIDNNNPTLILSMVATNQTTSTNAPNLIYLKDQPNDCSTLAYTENKALIINVVYFIKDDTLWRRVIVPADYATASNYCNYTSIQQLPSCISGYNSATRPFCKTNDEAILEGINDKSDFEITYYYINSYHDSNLDYYNYYDGSSYYSSADRKAQLAKDSTVKISLTTSQTIAGEEVSYTAEITANIPDIYINY